MAQNVASEDLRVRRTRKLLQQAMIELTIERGFAGLTVLDIAERAMVNRATFYRHYLDKYDLLAQYMDEMYQRLNSLNEADSLLDQMAAGQSDPPTRLVEMFKQVKEQADFFRVMLGGKGDPRFVQQIGQYIEKRMRRLLPADGLPTPPGAPPLDLTLGYIASAGVGALIWWLEHGLPYSPEQMAAWMVQFSNADLGVAFGPA